MLSTTAEEALQVLDALEERADMNCANKDFQP